MGTLKDPVNGTGSFDVPISFYQFLDKSYFSKSIVFNNSRICSTVSHSVLLPEL